MAKTATQAAGLEPIDRLEQKVKLLVALWLSWSVAMTWIVWSPAA